MTARNCVRSSDAETDSVICEFKVLFEKYLKQYVEANDYPSWCAGEGLQQLAENLKDKGAPEWGTVYEWTTEQSREVLDEVPF